MFTCGKWGNVAGGARLLVSKDLKEEGRGRAPSRETHVREVRACRSHKPSEPGRRFQAFPSHTRSQSLAAESLSSLSLTFFGDLKAPAASSLSPKPGCGRQRWVRLGICLPILCP